MIRVAIRSGVVINPVKFADQFFEKVDRFSCEYFKDVGSLCIHALIALRHTEIYPNNSVFS